MSSDIDFPCEGCSSDVNPIWVVGSEFFADSGLHNAGPSWDLDFVILLEVLGVALDEILSRHVLDGEELLSCGHPRGN